MEDRRTVKTRKAIIEAFVELLDQKAYDKISVTELCKRADINRGTFYLHFLDIYDLLEHLMKSYLKELKIIFSQGHDDPNNRKAVEKLIRFIDKKKNLFRAFLNQKGELHLVERIIPAISGALELEDKKENDYLLSFYAYGYQSIIKKWLEDDITMSADEMMEIVRKMP